MKFNILHENHDLLIVTPQYWREYQEAIKKHYPDHMVETSTLVSNGQAYLANKNKLKEQYEKIIENSN